MATGVESSYFLVLDADVICCKQVSFADLIPNGRALLMKSFKNMQPAWWRWSTKLLRTDPRIWNYGIRIWEPGIRTPRMGMGVTPAILSTNHARDLIQYLQQLRGLPLGKLLSDYPFTEYTLYYLYLEMKGLVDQVHQTDWPVRCCDSGTNVYHADEFEKWDVDRLFSDRKQRGFFTVCQNNTNISPDAVWQKVGPYLIQ